MTEAEFQHDKNWLREQIRDEFYLRAFDKKTSDRAQIVDDPEVGKAAEALPQADKLHADAEKLTPRKM
jgi:carboxyl-terminal processing protease